MHNQQPAFNNGQTASISRSDLAIFLSTTLMIRIIRLAVLFLLAPFALFAQSDTSSHLRVSLLTVGVGDEIYASFGHTGIRITDSVSGNDVVYNYGTFDGYQEGFELKFMRGKLLYFISFSSYQDFIAEYIHERRKVEEQELYIPQSAKKEILQFLIENERGDNKYYKYDFLFDNCATRIRDVFPRALGGGFKYGRVIPDDPKETYRQIINRYLRPLPWERLGINLLLGRPVDKVMTNEGIMFLPDYLRDGMAHAQLNGHPVAESPRLVLPANETLATSRPFTFDYEVPGVMQLVALLTIMGLFIERLRVLGKIMSSILLVVSGLLGCLMLFMWLGTDHLATKSNWNLLWCLPTNLLVPFLGRHGKDRYAAIALLLMVVALIIHVLHFQQLPLADAWPLWLALTAIFGTVYWRRTRNISA